MSDDIACRTKVAQIAPSRTGEKKARETAHPGLLLSRYLRVPAKGATHPTARRGLLDAAIGSSKNAKAVYELAFNRWKNSHPTGFMVNVEGRMVIGLGTSSPLETGLRLHHTYGVPIIPGSSLKGLAAHYCDRVWGNRAPEDQPTSGDVTEEELRFRRPYEEESDAPEATGKYHKVIFGSTEEAGHIVFHDAWLDPKCLAGDGKSGLVLDIMTPHHVDYYSDKSSSDSSRVPPTDIDGPNPIAFLSVTGDFWISVECDTPEDALATSLSGLAGDLLIEALQEWGIGGKTSSGYGRMHGTRTK